MKVSIHLRCDPLVHLFKPAADGRLTVTRTRSLAHSWEPLVRCCSQETSHSQT